MGVVCDVIFSLIAGLPEVYPNFFSVSDGVLQQYEKKFSGGFNAHGDPPGASLAGNVRGVKSRGVVTGHHRSYLHA